MPGISWLSFITLVSLSIECDAAFLFSVKQRYGTSSDIDKRINNRQNEGWTLNWLQSKLVCALSF